MFVVLCLAVLTFGCVAHETPKQSSGIVKFAENFQIIPHEGYTILKVREDGNWKTYILYKDKPPSGVEGTPIKVPVKRLVVMSSTHIAQLEAINGTNAIVGIMWGHRYRIYFPDIVKRLNNGSIVDLGPPNAPDYERLLELHPDLVVIFVSSGMGTEKVREKLKELGIPYIVDSEWLEKDPLARAEWVKFFGALLCKEKQAEKYFDKIVKNVEETKRIVEKAKSKPKVVWAWIWKGKIYVPRGNSYVARMIEEYAGGKYVFDDLNGTGYAIVNIEDLILRARDADVLIVPSYTAKSLKDLKELEPRLKEIKAFRDGRVYAITEDYWQLGLLHTDVVIRDLAAILHPDLFKNYKPRFFVRLT